MNVAPRVAALDHQQVVGAEAARERLDAGDEALVLRVSDDRRADAQVRRCDQRDEDGAGAPPHQSCAPAERGRCEGGRAQEQQRPGQDHRHEAARHPEVFRKDADLVEDRRREQRDGEKEHRLAPEAIARHQPEAEDRREHAGNGEIEIGKRPQRVGIVFRELSPRLPEEQRIQSCERQRRREDRRDVRCDPPGKVREALHREHRDQQRRGAGDCRVLPWRQVRQVHPVDVRVRRHQTGHVDPRDRARNGEREPEGTLHSLAAGVSETGGGEDGSDPEHRVEPQEQQQPEEAAGERREERDAVDRRPRVGEHGREEQRLHRDLAVWIAAEPGLSDVGREQCDRNRGSRPAKQAPSGKVHGERREHRPGSGRPQRAGETLKAVRDRHRRRKQVRKLADHDAAVRIQDVEPHEPDAVVVGAPVAFVVGVARKEQIAGERRQRCDRFVVDDEAAALRDLDPLVDVDAGILAADDVFGGRKEAPDGERDEGQRKQRGEGGPLRLRHAQAAARKHRDGTGDRDVRDQQARQTVLAERREREREGQRDRDADDDDPERALLGVQCCPPLAIEHRRAIDRGARQPADDEQGEHLQR